MSSNLVPNWYFSLKLKIMSFDFFSFKIIFWLSVHCFIFDKYSCDFKFSPGMYWLCSGMSLGNDWKWLTIQHPNNLIYHERFWHTVISLTSILILCSLIFICKFLEYVLVDLVFCKKSLQQNSDLRTKTTSITNLCLHCMLVVSLALIVPCISLHGWVYLHLRLRQHY